MESEFCCWRRSSDLVDPSFWRGSGSTFYRESYDLHTEQFTFAFERSLELVPRRGFLHVTIQQPSIFCFKCDYPW